MRTLADGEVLFSETDLINMGINRHDAKYNEDERRYIFMEIDQAEFYIRVRA